MTGTASVVFTKDELWLLRSVVRHELPQQETWKFPPAGLQLNDQIAEAILLCEDNGQPDAALVLTRGDTLIIDYLIPQDAKTPAGGTPLGKSILVKSFRARQMIAESEMLTTSEEGPGTPSQETIDLALARADRLERQRQKRAERRRRAKEA